MDMVWYSYLEQLRTEAFLGLRATFVGSKNSAKNRLTPRLTCPTKFTKKILFKLIELPYWIGANGVWGFCGRGGDAARRGRGAARAGMVRSDGTK